MIRLGEFERLFFGMMKENVLNNYRVESWRIRFEITNVILI